MERPYVGILLNQSMYRGIPQGKTQTENLELYEEGSRMYGIKPCYLRLEDLHPDQNKVPAYVKEGERYRKVLIPCPRVIHNRALHFSRVSKERIRQLLDRNYIIFNYWNRYSKWYVHRVLSEDPHIRPHLPYTVMGTPENLHMMMRRYSGLFLKPNSGSIGVGIMHLSKNGGKWQLSYSSVVGGKRAWRTMLFSNRLPEYIRGTIKKRSYQIQQQLPLARYQKKPFDIRVSVQRGASGDWNITGMVGKVAAAGRFISNVAQGGKVYPLAFLLRQYPSLSIKRTEAEISALSLRIVERLSEVVPGLADVGLDIGITADGFPMFIECNGRDQRYSFRNGRMIDEWKATYSNPMGYASYLLQTIEERSESEPVIQK
ncbi:YheC/YheD family endospore coat-associated protein [Aneurinibacillus tyrosinisolvens]|uniref:YheC/YheD family endospore coat-associated protein n=1 Tax=Aneurinibacillus tyrosinisolvens TaxID=1443435 RepID=UPI00063F10DF|nr:YheC/YheD family protein [Aneurinibacillus tyrosinisolvens]